MTTWKIGDRVRIAPQWADQFVQPWRDRFAKGRAGTVVALPSENVRGVLVEWDHGRVRYPNEWRLVHRSAELEAAEK